MKIIFRIFIPLVVIALLSIGADLLCHCFLGEDFSTQLEQPWFYVSDTVLWLTAFTLAYVIYLLLARGGKFKQAFPDLIPLLVAALWCFGLGFFVESIFSPDSILRPWIYFADVVPWIMVLTLGFCLQQRLTQWNSWPGFPRSVFIAMIGIWVGFPLDSVLHDVNDEIGARRVALAGEDDPYDLYGDESGMRNHGTRQLAQDTREAFMDGLVASVILLPIILLVASLVHLRANILKFLIRKSATS